jgi:hypothetical protein
MTMWSKPDKEGWVTRTEDGFVAPQDYLFNRHNFLDNTQEWLDELQGKVSEMVVNDDIDSKLEVSWIMGQIHAIETLREFWDSK